MPRKESQIPFDKKGRSRVCFELCDESMSALAMLLVRFKNAGKSVKIGQVLRAAILHYLQTGDLTRIDYWRTIKVRKSQD